MQILLRASLLVLGFLLLAVPPVAAQRGGGRGLRLDPALVDPVVRDGPPTLERLQRLVQFADSESTAYEAERSLVLKETAATRDSVQQVGPLAGLPFAGGPRGGVGLDREAMQEIERVRRQHRELADAQRRLDRWLLTLLGKARYKPYEEWRTEQREAAVAGIRQELLRRFREEGGAYGP